MFEHKYLDGEKHRTLPPTESFINEEILETREPKSGETYTQVGRLQHGVAGEVLVERFLPPETVGDKWPTDAGTIWWSVVGHPPHGGIVADFNKAKGGAYKRTLDKEKNIVAYAEAGEEVVLKPEGYSVTKAESELVAPSILELRKMYYS